MKEICLSLVLATMAASAPAQEKVKTAGNSATASSKLYGIFSAPTGTSIVIQNNGKVDLSLVAGKENGKTLPRIPLISLFPF